MSDYTPTTDQIRNGYIDGVYRNGSPGQFDRWLEQQLNEERSISFEVGIQMENNRIIKLLEAYANAKCDDFCGSYCDCFGKYEAQRFIALIKGENK